MDWLVVDGFSQAGLLEALEAFCRVVLNGCEGSDDGRGAEPVGGVGEVGEVTLDLWLEDHGRLRVAQRRPGSAGPSAPLSQSWQEKDYEKNPKKNSHLVASRSSFLLNCSALLPDLPVRYSAT